jgi:hypothetical protein
LSTVNNILWVVQIMKRLPFCYIPFSALLSNTPSVCFPLEWDVKVFY